MDMRHCKVLLAEHFLIRDINQKSGAGTQNEQSWHVWNGLEWRIMYIQKL